MKNTYYFSHKGKNIESNSFVDIKSKVKDLGLKTATIYRDTGYFINRGQRPQQHYNYRPKY